MMLDDPSPPALDRAPTALMLDLLHWLMAGPRPYAEVMEAWRTSCPRHPVWEDASDLGLVKRERPPGCSAQVSLTPAGQSWLHEHRASQA